MVAGENNLQSVGSAGHQRHAPVRSGQCQQGVTLGGGEPPHVKYSRRFQGAVSLQADVILTLYGVDMQPARTFWPEVTFLWCARRRCLSRSYGDLG